MTTYEASAARELSVNQARIDQAIQRLRRLARGELAFDADDQGRIVAWPSDDSESTFVTIDAAHDDPASRLVEELVRVAGVYLSIGAAVYRGTRSPLGEPTEIGRLGLALYDPFADDGQAVRLRGTYDHSAADVAFMSRVMQHYEANAADDGDIWMRLGIFQCDPNEMDDSSPDVFGEAAREFIAQHDCEPQGVTTDDT